MKSELKDLHSISALGGLPLEELIGRARILVEAMPYINAFRGATIVIKYGGNAMIDEELKRTVIQDIVLMEHVGMRPVVVHGGGPEISALMKKLGMKPRFVEGQRVTDAETLEVVEMVLAGKLNGEIVSRINHAGGHAVGLSGKDGGLIAARKMSVNDTEKCGSADIGFVGEVEEIRPGIISLLAENQFIPVISPLGVDEMGQTFNINADSVAAEIAASLRAVKLILITDVKGIYRESGDESSILPTIRVSEVEDLIKSGIITGGMIPKVRACVKAIMAGVSKTHVLDGSIPHSLLLELFTDRGIGTQIIP